MEERSTESAKRIGIKRSVGRRRKRNVKSTRSTWQKHTYEKMIVG